MSTTLILFLRALRSAVLMIVVLLGMHTTGSAQGVETVTGRVVDQTGLVLPGVSVQLLADGVPVGEAVSGPDGTYRLENAAVGPAELVFRLINFSAARTEVAVTEGTTEVPDVVLVIATSADITITASRTFRNLAELESPAQNLVGIAGSSSEGAVTAAQLAVRPVNRAA